MPKSDLGVSHQITNRRTLRSKLFHFLQHVYTCVLVIICLMFLLLFYAGSAGVPKRYVHRLETWLLNYDVDLEIRKVRWRFPFSLVAYDVDYFMGEGKQGAPFISVKEIVIPMHPVAWARGEWPVERVSFTNGTLRLAAYSGPIRDHSPGNLRLEKVHGDVDVGPGEVRFPRMQGVLKGMDFSTKGVFYVPGERDHSKSLAEHWLGLYFPPSTNPLPAWIAEITAEFNQVRFDGGVITADFDLNPLVLENNHVDLYVRGKEALCRGVNLTNWVLQGGLHGPDVAVTNVMLQDAQGSLNGYAAYHFSNDVIDAALASGFAPKEVLQIIPQSWSDLISDWGVTFGDHARISVLLGPSVSTQLVDEIQGSIFVNQTDFRGIVEQNVQVEFELDKDVLWINRYRSDMGAQSNQGSLDSSGMLYFENRSFIQNFTADFKPEVLLPACSAALAHFIQGFDFYEKPPLISGRLTGQWDDPGSIRYKGHCHSGPFRWDGVSIQAFNTDLAVTNEFVCLTNMVLTREEGDLVGNLSIPLGVDEVDFDITSKVNPKAVAELIHPVVADILEPFEFKGFTDVYAYGNIDYAVRTQMNFGVDVSASNMSVYCLDYDSAFFSVFGTGDEYRVSNIDGQLYGGNMTGEMVLFPVDEESYRFNVTSAVDSIEFAQLMTRFGRNAEEMPKEVMQGLLRGTVLLSGLTGTNWINTIVAKGDLVIDDGCLLQIPLFGPLSRFLSRILPNLGCLAQTEFTTAFSMRDGVLHIKDAHLYGNVISIVIQGDITVATEVLDLEVQVKLLRNSMVAKLVNLVTYPLTKIFLEFHLGGTLDEPDWRPVNVPKELYLDFQ